MISTAIPVKTIDANISKKIFFAIMFVTTTVLAERLSVIPIASGIRIAMEEVTKAALAITPLKAANPAQMIFPDKVLSSAT